MVNRRGRPAWFYIALGCGGLLLMVVLLGGTAVFLGYRAIRSVTDEMSDPVKRTESAKRLLGAERLPDGYYPAMSFSLPMLLEMVYLTDRPPSRNGIYSHPSESLFIYLELPLAWATATDGEEGMRRSPLRVLGRHGFEIERGPEIASDRLSIGQQRIEFAVHRGGIKTDLGRRIEGLVAVLSVGCPDESKVRTGVWAGPDPSAGRPVEEAEFAGTLADPERVRAFMSHFNLCGGGP